MLANISNDAQIPFTETEDSMECPKCGYMLSPFDVHCPRCAHLADTQTKQQQNIAPMTELLSGFEEIFLYLATVTPQGLRFEVAPSDAALLNSRARWGAQEQDELQTALPFE
jgi:hypothetical protein